MKYLIITIVALALFSTNALTQNIQTVPPIDKSPMDESTYPANYPLLKIQDKATTPLIARVSYSRPQKNGRIIFGGLLEYNAVWRFGANENTEIEFFKDVKISKVLIKKGKYSVFAIPNADKWTIILNKDLYNWGAFSYDKAKDVVRVDVAIKKVTDITETFFIYFEKTSTGFSMIAGWDDVQVSLPIII